MINLRIMAKPNDAKEIIERLKTEFNVLHVSGPYNCRNDVRVRYYVDVEIGQTSDQLEMAQAFKNSWIKSKAEGLI